VTVVVLTRARLQLLCRALASIAAQTRVRVHLILVIDDCEETASAADTVVVPTGAIRSARVLHERRNGDRSGPRRIAALRERSVDLVETRWTAFLDDDNEFAPDHLASLLAVTGRSGAPLAHSWRSLWTRDGRVWPLAGMHPWTRDRRAARRQYCFYERAGIYERGSNVVHDQVVPGCRELSMVDTSEWLFETAFLRGLEFCRTYSPTDWKHSRTEDYKLLDQIVEHRIDVPSTCRPTLAYYLGGYSNQRDADGAAADGWFDR
jgi:glycosyltransferase involved in cell wall biosynthesis